MIQMIVTYTCGQCESPNIGRNGHSYKGSQKYHCIDCGWYGTLNAQPGYDACTQVQVRRGVLGRVSLHGLERLLCLSRRTIGRWVTRWLNDLPLLETSLLPVKREDVLKLDELWSFVVSKHPERWLWLALYRHTRQVAYWLGDRSENSAIHLRRRLTDAYRLCSLQ